MKFDEPDEADQAGQDNQSNDEDLAFNDDLNSDESHDENLSDLEAERQYQFEI